MKSVIFDLDGTIVDTSKDVLDAFRLSFDKFNLPHSGLARNVIGPPAIDIIKNVTNCDDSIAKEVLSEFRSIHDRSLLECSSLMPNAKSTIVSLVNLGIRVCIATNKPRSGTLNILRKFNIIDYFDNIVCLSDPGIFSKYDAVMANIAGDLKECYMVGDAVGDINAANKSGVVSVAYTLGFGNTSELLAALPKFVISDLSDLISIVN